MNCKKLAALLIRQATADDYAGIREFLLESSHIYPDIEEWWMDRVLPTITNGRRLALVVDSGASLDGLLIAKPGEYAKFCSLRLRESVRDRGVGRVLLTEGLTRLLARNPSRFHVTISEGAEEGAIPFFESVGFQRIAVQRNLYANGVDEYVYACPTTEITEVLRSELAQGFERTLFGVKPIQRPSEHTLLMSLRPEYADLVMRGRKTIEFRRKFSKKYEGARIVFYITHPVKQFSFTARIAKVDHRKKDTLWGEYKESGGITREVFDEYFAGNSYGYAIQLTNIEQVPNQIGLERARQVAPEIRPPQSFQRLEPASPLVRALNLPIHI
jgi:predicted transcriptional regulator/ribosomal protein S18 acetylase RimI-like enzyme